MARRATTHNSRDPINGPPEILFLLGFSGTGKTFMGDVIAEERQWLHLNLDTWGVDQPTEPQVQQLLTTYLQTGQHDALVAGLRQRATDAGKAGVVLGFASGLTQTRENIEAVSRDIRIRYLTGSPEHCIASFLERERTTGRGLPREWWIGNNLPVAAGTSGELLVAYLARPSMQPYCVPAFNADGTHRDQLAILEDLMR